MLAPVYPAKLSGVPQFGHVLLESVHPIALAAGAASFYNKRTLMTLETERQGRLFMLDIGAMTIGSIVQTYAPGAVSRGAEKGYFRFGGSTVVLLWGKKGPTVDSDLLSNSSQGLETLVKYGTRIAGPLDSASVPNGRSNEQ